VRVLVIEDDGDLVALLRELLEAELGVTVDQAGDGRDALRLMRAAPPALVLLDLLTPGMGGHEVLEHMRRDRELLKIPVIVITAVTTLPPVAPPVVSCIRKPFSIDELIGEARRHLPPREQRPRPRA
jgi:CheY-like chemotaxis protein